MSSGNSFADGWLEPALQKSGLSGGRTAEVIQTRPLLVEHRVVHVVLARPDRFVAPVRRRLRHRRRASRGVFGSRTVSGTWLAVWRTGSSTGR